MGGTKAKQDNFVVLGKSKRQPWEEEPLTELDGTNASVQSKRSRSASNAVGTTSVPGNSPLRSAEKREG